MNREKRRIVVGRKRGREGESEGIDRKVGHQIGRE